MYKGASMSGKYRSKVGNFLTADNKTIIGHLALGATNQQLLMPQRRSWNHQITFLKHNLVELPSGWTIILEYSIPRGAKHIDIVLLADDLIFIVAFKDRETKHSSDAISQVEDYALDIRDFHKYSASKTIIPIVWSSDANEIKNNFSENNDFVKPTLFANKENLCSVIQTAFEYFTNSTDISINDNEWDNSECLPTPTIIEAAQHLFSGQNVRDILLSHADSENLALTTNAILNAIKKAQAEQKKIIFFVTSIPGAGKTLEGLNIVHSVNGVSGKSVFLSGNGPLVKVLTEALARDHSKRTNTKIEKSRREIAFVQNVHHFLDFYLNNEQIPEDNIIVFDEAQRARNAEHSKRKFDREFSEAEMLLNIMNRNDGWAVIVALIGSGQEIHAGEAGLSEWGETIKNKFSDWQIYISPELKEGNSSIASFKLFEEVPLNLSITELPELHLKVSVRSDKAKKLSEWVEAILEDKPLVAKHLLQNHLKDYPIFLTRSLEKARQFLRDKNRGHRRTGLIASSGARRLRPLGLDVKTDMNVADWFLNSKGDVRSSCFLEIPATELAVQGLELDWVGLCWGDDFRKEEHGWSYYRFYGAKWQIERRKESVKNKYRVLLTRAREGLIVFIPEGSTTDHTRPQSNYDGIYEYLKRTGVEEV